MRTDGEYERWRRGWDLHPRHRGLPRARHFQCRTFGRSVTPPREELAEGRGFEPPRDLLGPYPISSRTPSTGLGHPSASSLSAIYRVSHMPCHPGVGEPPPAGQRREGVPWRQIIQRPPSISSDWPVMYRASSLARNATTDATSSGSATYPIGTELRTRSMTSFGRRSCARVLIAPGHTALTFTWNGASSRASERVKPTTPIF